MAVIEETITKLIAGAEKKGRVINEREKKLTAYHEVGHAITAKYLETIDPVHQISIIPRGMAGGFTMTLPQSERNYLTKKSMEDEIINLLGGRAAEAIKLDDISSGASNDIQRATQLAKDMVMKYGFSEKLGVVCLDEGQELFLGRDLQRSKSYSEEVAAEIDLEVRELLNNSLEKAKEILKEHDVELEAVTKALYEKETLSGEEFEGICKECQKN